VSLNQNVKSQDQWPYIARPFAIAPQRHWKGAPKCELKMLLQKKISRFVRAVNEKSQDQVNRVSHQLILKNDSFRLKKFFWWIDWKLMPHFKHKETFFRRNCFTICLKWFSMKHMNFNETHKFVFSFHYTQSMVLFILFKIKFVQECLQFIGF
jgi:hypothetical protein